MSSSDSRPSTAALALAYALVYLIWGSTYLAIRFTVETIPPIFSGGVRFVIAGIILMVFRIFLCGDRTTAVGWKFAIIASILPFVVSYGLLTVAETIVPSSAAGLLVALEPLWFCLIGWIFFKGAKPGKFNYIGIISGFTGVYFLMAEGPGLNLPAGSSGNYTLGLLLVMLSSIAWVFGAFISRSPRIHTNPFMSSGMQMFSGGCMMLLLQLVISACTGNFAGFHVFSFRSLLALGYLIIFGSIVAYTSFLWLMRVEPAGRVSTHAFVNPIVAVLLGWLIGGEALHKNIFIAMPLIIISVLLMIWKPNDSHMAAKK